MTRASLNQSGERVVVGWYKNKTVKIKFKELAMWRESRRAFGPQYTNHIPLSIFLVEVTS